MKALGVRARAALLDLISALVTGRSVAPGDRAAVRGSLALDGFRKAARGYLVRRLLHPGSRQDDVTLLVPALDGLFTIAVSSGDLAVGEEILRSGRYEPHIASFYRRHLRPGMTVLDVGANVGFHALHAAALVGPSGRVFAVEPDPRNVALLRVSLSLPGAPAPVEVIEAALSDADGTLVLSDLGNRANSGARFTHEDRRTLERLVHGPDPRFSTARGLRWDGMHLDTRIDLVKIDIEGSEPRAVRGMAQSLERHRPTVLSEFAPSNLRTLGGIDPEAYVAWFLERGYASSVLEEGSGALASAGRAEIAARLGTRHHLDLVFSPA